MPSNRLILCRPLLLLPSIFPSIRVFSNGSVLHIRWPKYWSFSFSILLQHHTEQPWLSLYPLPPPPPSPPPPHSSRSSPEAGLPVLHSSFPPVIHLTPDCVNMLMLLFHSSHSLLPALCKSIPYIRVSIPFLQSFISIIFFNYIYLYNLVKKLLQNRGTLLSQKFNHWFLIFSSHLAIIFSFHSFKEQN